MANVFLYGTLRHAGLLQIVLGHVPEARLTAGRLEGYRVARAEGHGFPLILEAKGAACEGLLLRDVSAEERARLDYYELGFGYELREVEVGGAPALVYFPHEGLWQPAEDWSLARWREEHWPYTRHAAPEMMALMGIVPAEELPRYFGTINMRAHARALAEARPQPATRRFAELASAVDIEARETAHLGFFKTERMLLKHALFDGGESPTLDREVFLTGDAALVLPYDPKRDRVLLIEQFRMGPFARGDSHPWTFEPIAGRVDPAESPEAAALRECEEEAGLTLRELLPVAAYYPSPGEVTTFFHTYLGLADLPDSVAGQGGLEAEQEDIRSHVLSYEEAEALVRSGEINVGPLLHLLLWLKAERPMLRG